MDRRIIVNSIPGEKRMAILEEGQLVEFSLFRTSDQNCLGNIYRGTVKRIVHGMQSAFVEFGHERTGFIYLRDLRQDISYEEFERNLKDDDEEEEGSDGSAPAAAAPVPEYVKEGQQIIVQVIKEPIGQKGARLTTHATLTGRFAVLMPTIRHTGVSKKITDPEIRRDLQELARRTVDKGYGVIIRTMAGSASRQIVEREIVQLIKKWRTVQDNFKKGKNEELISEAVSPVVEAIKNTYTDDLGDIICDDKADHDEALKYVAAFIPERKSSVRLHELPYPIFEYYGIEAEIDKTLGKKLWLKSGGFIYIEQTEALTVVDVNTGKFLGHGSLEQTVLKTNLEAADEIAYQLRLRNIAGIIVVDFIDMRHHNNRMKVIRALEMALERDPAKNTVYQFTRLGLIQITRKRTSESALATLTESCPYCGGTAHILSRESVGFKIVREMLRQNQLYSVRRFHVEAHPDVVFMLEHAFSKEFKEACRTHKITVELKSDGTIHREHFTVTEA